MLLSRAYVEGIRWHASPTSWNSASAVMGHAEKHIPRDSNRRMGQANERALEGARRVLEVLFEPLERRLVCKGVPLH